jgi:hypothetical protein
MCYAVYVADLSSNDLSLSLCTGRGKKLKALPVLPLPLSLSH